MAKIVGHLDNVSLDEVRILKSILTDLTALKTAVDTQKTAIDELIDDHATYKTVVDELTTWAEALATKLNSDAGVTDADYDATITADAPAALTASDPTAVGTLSTE